MADDGRFVCPVMPETTINGRIICRMLIGTFPIKEIAAVCFRFVHFALAF